MAEELPELVVSGVDAWRAWLAAHADEPTGVRLVLAKKEPGPETTLTYDQALQEALCQGWIDGQTGRRNEATYVVRFTPRRSRSIWSRRNVDYVGRLQAEGRMLPRGLAEVQRAQVDGRWEAAYAGSAEIEVPEELTAALEANPAAQAMWQILNRQNRYAVLHRLHTAKRADTRTRRIEQYVAMLARGDTIYPQQRQLPANGDG